MRLNGMLKVDWNDIDSYTTEEISYFLSLEGKSIDSISKIRNLDRKTIEKHIISGKIKYGILAKSGSEKQLFYEICTSGKFDKINALKNLDKFNEKKLVEFIKLNYTNMRTKDKETALWILGEIGDMEVFDVLVKGVVHKHVNVRRMAVSAVGKLGDKLGNKLGENALIRALDDTNPQVIMYAIKALIKIKSEKAVKKIECIKNNTDKEYLKICSEQYLNIIKQNI
ncbi:HEAT repeat domain-containing protein [Clostridium tyrobutyricum]|uniref:HEAT repeat domain-containing protein n=1 Tax=Clostridium tyrobutyricum TaxID=1519 RepID=UPI002B1F1266|nr:HEAT repeat domain-containing protein [Clostridium tyrobutyricum]MEA5008583.1 HEAT repeat domain-containing protein [Clostridium tyrobutyricum]